MAGYDWGNGKSNNAVAAENNGCVPKSNITSSLLKQWGIPLTVNEVKKLIENKFFTSSEWHHTSSKFNITYFYSMEILKMMCEDKDEMEKIKESLKENKEDIVYAKIEVTDFEKVKRGIWKPIFNYYHAKVTGFETKKMCYIETSCGLAFRKKVDNLSIQQYITIDDFTKNSEEKKEQKLKEQKLKDRELLEKKKFDLFNDCSKYIDEINNELINKLKRVRSNTSFEKISIEIKKEIDKIKYNFLENLNNIDYKEWSLLPKEKQHPAPKHILKAKNKSGLTWNEFTEKIKQKG